MHNCKSNTVITSKDQRRLKELVDRTPWFPVRAGSDLKALRHGIRRACVVSPRQVPRNVVTMNSVVVLRNLDSGGRLMCTLAYPSEARTSQSVSVARPLGRAMLGRRVGEIIRWPGGVRDRRLRIQSIPYQPEAAGDLHL